MYCAALRLLVMLCALLCLVCVLIGVNFVLFLRTVVCRYFGSGT